MSEVASVILSSSSFSDMVYNHNTVVVVVDIGCKIYRTTVRRLQSKSASQILFYLGTPPIIYLLILEIFYLEFYSYLHLVKLR